MGGSTMKVLRVQISLGPVKRCNDRVGTSRTVWLTVLVSSCNVFAFSLIFSCGVLGGSEMKSHGEIDVKTKENGEIISNHESTPALSIDKKSPDVIVPSPANG